MRKASFFKTFLIWSILNWYFCFVFLMICSSDNIIAWYFAWDWLKHFFWSAQQIETVVYYWTKLWEKEEKKRKKKAEKKKWLWVAVWSAFHQGFFLHFGKILCSIWGWVLGSERREGWSITLMDNGWKLGHWLLKIHVCWIKLISPSQDTPVTQIITNEFL